MHPEISLFAVLHDDVDVALLSEGIIVFDDVGTIDPREYRRFMHGLFPLGHTHPVRVYLLEYVYSLVTYGRREPLFRSDVCLLFLLIL